VRMRTRVRRTAVAIGMTVALGAGALAAFGPSASLASSHREAPLVAADPQIDNTDVYAFVSPDKPTWTTVVSNWVPFEYPAGGPNFYSFAEGVHYDINIDNNGDAVPDIIYRWIFTNHYRNPDTFLYNTGQVTSLDDTDLNFYQTYDLQKITKSETTTLLNNAMVAPSDVGDVSMPDYGTLMSQASYTIGGGNNLRSYAGQADDPFFLDLRVFDLLYGASLGQQCLFQEACNDSLAGYNVQSIAFSVPSKQLARAHNLQNNPIIGVWSTAERQSMRVENGDGTQSFSGPYVEVSRLGMPLVNEVVIPVGKKDFWNASYPKDDLANFGSYITNPELPTLIQAIYGIPAPATPRNDLVAVFATGLAGLNQPPNVVPSEMIRLNMTTPVCNPGSCNNYSDLGVIGGDLAGYPNGRRLADDVIDISLQVVEGELVGNPNDLNDGVDQNDVKFQKHFPYVALPHSGSETNPRG
jgi:Domain of unknown function (DUF4331)